MKTNIPHTEPPPLQVHVVGDKVPNDVEYDRLLDEHHYLGSDHPVGDYLRQVVYEAGEPVALLSWGSACYALADRDLHIDWDATHRAERQKLVVQNRRYCLLVPKGSRPNLASRALAAAFRALPGQWVEQFGYMPLAAETFSDIEAFAGTCYKATGWEALGMTKGYSRHRADFYVHNARPKKLWFKTFRPDALALLKGGKLPPEHEAGAHSDNHGVLPLPKRKVESLMEMMLQYPDPRDRNRTYPCFAVLTIVAMALMTGARDISSIARFAQRMSQAQRKQLTLPFKKDTKFRKAASYDVIYRLLKLVDPEKLGVLISRWLSEHAEGTPGLLAVDGKMIGEVTGVVTLADTATGVAVATAPMRHKSEGERGEAVVARNLVRNAGALDGQTVSGDALHCNRETGRAILSQGGDYLLQVRNNQPGTLGTVKSATHGLPLFARSPKPATGG